MEVVVAAAAAAAEEQQRSSRAGWAMSDQQLPDTLNAAWKNNKSRFGYKMLQKMGWSEEKGLGKHESGTVSAIKLKKREEGAGLGVEKLTDGAGARGWSHTANGFTSVLDALKAQYGTGKSKGKEKEEKKKRKKSKREKEENHGEGDDLAPLRVQVGMK